MHFPSLQHIPDSSGLRSSRNILPAVHRNNSVLSNSPDSSKILKATINSSQNPVKLKPFFQLTPTSKTAAEERIEEEMRRTNPNTQSYIDQKSMEFKVIFKNKGILIKRKTPLLYSGRRFDVEPEDPSMREGFNSSMEQEDDRNLKEGSIYGTREKDGGTSTAPMHKKKTKKVTFLGSTDLLGEISHELLPQNKNRHSIFQMKAQEERMLQEEYELLKHHKSDSFQARDLSKPTIMVHGPEGLVTRNETEAKEPELVDNNEKKRNFTENSSESTLNRSPSKEILKLQKPLISPLTFRKKEYNLAATFYTPKGEENPWPLNYQNRYTKSIVLPQMNNLFIDLRNMRGLNNSSNSAMQQRDSKVNMSITAVSSPQTKTMGVGIFTPQKSPTSYAARRELLKGN